MKKHYFILNACSIFSFFNIYIHAQTNPPAQALPYSQNFSGMAHSSTLLPVGWQGWSIGASSGTTFRLTPPTGDLPLTALSTAATNSGGLHNYNGKPGFLSSGSVDAALCLAINTTGVYRVNVSFDMMTIRNQRDVSNTRINQVDLQYRIGTTGNFISVSGILNGLYQNNTTNQTGSVTTPQNSQSKAFILPAACNNQPLVQLRWVQRDFSGSGGRPSFAVDNVVICNSFLSPSVSISGSTSFCTGGTAVFTATAMNGGTTPAYQWKKNGVNIGSNSATLNIGGLVVGDQISCIMTSTASCLTALSATSDPVTISEVAASPEITDAIITNASCNGVADGSIDITVSGGTPPYTICWDTTNIVNGAQFAVTLGTKPANHPYFNQGTGGGLAFLIDGEHAKVLHLTEGIMYTFNVAGGGHPFHISSDSVGGNSNFMITTGQTGAPTGFGTVTFTPGSSHSSSLYYPCASHTLMGYKIFVQNYCSEDVSGLKNGIYNVVVTDANGCSVTAQYTVGLDPSTLSLSSSITDANCGLANGVIDLTVSGGTSPYSICWDTVNVSTGAQFAVTFASKTASHPYFGMGSGFGYLLNGLEAPNVTLIHDIDYTFNIMTTGHPFHISTDSSGGNTNNIVAEGQSGAPDDVGLVQFRPNALHQQELYYACSFHQYMGYKASLQQGYCIEDLMALPGGIYNVVVRDAVGCREAATYEVGQNGSAVSAVLVSNTDASCFGIADGSVDADVSGEMPVEISGEGPVFAVISEPKNHSHPMFGTGSANGFAVNGVQGKELTLIRGLKYAFSVFTPGHPFFISTSSVGGPGSLGSEVTLGVLNSMTTNGTLYFTPDESHPPLLYYQCGAHNNMGYIINIIDHPGNGDLQNCMAGNYSVFYTDNTGCTSPSPLNIFIAEPAAGVFYFDDDGDLFGDTDESAMACIAPPGFVSDSGDCNVTDPEINPLAMEECNGIDDNCEGNVDEVCESTLNIKLFFEGLYIGSGSMTSPVFNTGVSSDPTESDSVIISLHEVNSPFSLLFSKAVIVNIFGECTLAFPSVLEGNDVYISVRSRNNLETWSRIPVSLSFLTSYDFTVSSAGRSMQKNK